MRFHQPEGVKVLPKELLRARLFASVQGRHLAPVPGTAGGVDHGEAGMGRRDREALGLGVEDRRKAVECPTEPLLLVKRPSPSPPGATPKRDLARLCRAPGDETAAILEGSCALESVAEATAIEL